jgi:hypothetical protein
MVSGFEVGFSKVADWQLQQVGAYCQSNKTRYAILFDGVRMILKVYKDLQFYDETSTDADEDILPCGEEVILAVIHVQQTRREFALTTLMGFVREALADAVSRVPGHSEATVEIDVEALLKKCGI